MSAVSTCSYYITYSSSFSEVYFDVARSTCLGICLALPHFCPLSSCSTISSSQILDKKFLSGFNEFNLVRVLFFPETVLGYLSVFRPSASVLITCRTVKVMLAFLVLTKHVPCSWTSYCLRDGLRAVSGVGSLNPKVAPFPKENVKAKTWLGAYCGTLVPTTGSSLNLDSGLF